MFPKRRKSNFTGKCLNTFVAHCSFCSASEDFQSYDDSAEPIATEEEATSKLNK